MKNRMILLLCLIFTLVLSSMTFASEDKVENTEVLFHQNEVHDISVLYDRANKGQGDIAPIKWDAESKLTNAPQNLKVENKSTTQKLKQVKKSNNIIETSYVTTTFDSIVDSEKMQSSMLLNADSWDRWDGSVTFRHVSTYYYNTYTDGSGFQWVQPQRLDSKWYKSGTDTTLVSATCGILWHGYNGVNLNASGNKSTTGLTGSNISYGTTYTNTASSSEIGGCGYIRCVAVGEYVAFQQISTIKRVNSTSKWTFTSNKVWRLQ